MTKLTLLVDRVSPQASRQIWRRLDFDGVLVPSETLSYRNDTRLWVIPDAWDHGRDVLWNRLAWIRRERIR